MIDFGMCSYDYSCTSKCEKVIASEKHSEAPNPIENLAIFIKVVQITQKGPFIGRKLA